ncbi:MAG: ABC transporter transmembrane domain-containing protein, partial [Sediminibacterium sp.]
MKILYPYLKNYWKLGILALFLAAINQGFSLLDPLLFRYIIDNYASKFSELTKEEYIRGVGFLLCGTISVAFISRIAKNFQDYFVNVITQKLGAQMYSDGLEHSLGLSYAQFEDQRSGETLGILQKVRTDVEKLIASFVNTLFTSFIGIVFVMVYAIRVHWLIAPVFLAVVPLLGILSSVLSKRIKKIQKVIVGETTALAGSTTESLRNIELVKSLGLVKQEINRLNNTTEKILGLELRKVKYIRSLSFIQGTAVNFLRTCIMFIMLYLIFQKEISIGQMFSLMFYSFFIFGPLQELGNVINTFREAEVSLANFKAIMEMPKEPKPAHPIIISTVTKLTFDKVSFQHQSAKTKAIQEISFEV